MKLDLAVDLPMHKQGEEQVASLQHRSLPASGAELAENGFVHIKNVVPAERVAEFKRLAIEYGKAPNVHATPVFDILLDELNVQRIVEAYVGEDIFYFGRCTIRPADAAREHHYHDDAKGFPVAVNAPPISLIAGKQSNSHDIAKHPIWPVYRLFIYLDDHQKFSGGTKVRRGSHRRYSLVSIRGLKALTRFRFRKILMPGAGYVNPPVGPGDAVLFNLKCKHSGYFVRLSAPFDRFALPTFWDNVIKRLTLNTRPGRAILSLIAHPFRETRTSVIIDFCTESDWSRGFQVNRLLNPNDRDKWDQVFDCNRPEFAARLAKKNVRILNNPSMKQLESFLRSH